MSWKSILNLNIIYMFLNVKQLFHLNLKSVLAGGHNSLLNIRQYLTDIVGYCQI